ncbi:MAG: carboxypeptidase regulatory-like domain-containing protein [Candidatus Acidiferrales bacterium]
MNRLAFLAMVLSWGAVVAPAQDARSQVAGTVRSATTGEAIPGAAVTLLSSNGKGPISGRTTTDPSGTFALSGLAPGQYQIAIGKSGYRTFLSITPVTIAPGSVSVASLVADLWPYSAISGQVVDAEGQPVADAELRAYAIAYESQGPKLSLATKARTDKVGQYRLPDLPAGKYLLQLSPRTPGPSGKSYADVVTYYPGAALPSQAVPIELNWGAEFASADVRMPPGPSYTIAGVVWDAEGEGPCRRCAVQMIQRDGDYRVSLPQTAQVSSDGTFLLRGLSSGDYALIASRGSSRVAQTEVSIRDWPVEDARLTLGSQQAVSGQIVLENPPDGIDVTDWSLQLSPVNMPAGWPQEVAEVTADRRFTIPEIPSARYRLELRGLPPGAYLKTLRGGQLLPNSEVVVPPDSALSGLRLVVGFDAPNLLGKVRSPDNPAAVQARVFVLPQSGPTGSQIPRTTETNPDGSFSLASIVPGSYTVYALPVSTSLQLFDPAVQVALRGYARRVDLDSKETVTIEVPLAPQLP